MAVLLMLTSGPYNKAKICVDSYAVRHFKTSCKHSLVLY